MATKVETRIIPEETSRKFYLQHLAVYSFVNQAAAGKTVLDVGCGDGYGASFLARQAKSVVAVDYMPEVVLAARNKYQAPNLNYLVMDAVRLNFPDASFDLACSFQVIEHIPEDLILPYLAGLKRVLKDSGRLYLSTLNLDKAMKCPRTYEKNPAHIKEFRLKELRAVLSGVFKEVLIYGLHLSLRHKFFLRLKKSGIFKGFPAPLNPVQKFYERMQVGDYRISLTNLDSASDFICVCSK